MKRIMATPMRRHDFLLSFLLFRMLMLWIEVGVPIASLDANGLSCLYNKVHKSNPSFQLATISSRNWLGRVAARKAIAAAEGLPNKEPSTYDLPFYENSVSGQAPVCVKSASPDFYSSNKIAQGTITKFGKPS